MAKLSILIVNKNCLNYTKNCIADLLNQNCRDFEIYLYDNNSEEIGTRAYIYTLQGPLFKEVRINDRNVPLSHLWNEIAQKTQTPYFCFLNNDVRLPRNFVKDTIDIFEKESKVGCVVHATNHPSYQVATKNLNYKIIKEKFRQGWDFSFRRDAYTEIPAQLEFFCGDDFLYENLFNKRWDAAFALSSPIIHYQGRTKSVKRNSGKDIREYLKLGYPHNLKPNTNYSQIYPTFKELIDENNDDN